MVWQFQLNPMISTALAVNDDVVVAAVVVVAKLLFLLLALPRPGQTSLA